MLVAEAAALTQARKAQAAQAVAETAVKMAHLTQLLAQRILVAVAAARKALQVLRRAAQQAAPAS